MKIQSNAVLVDANGEKFFPDGDGFVTVPDHPVAPVAEVVRENLAPAAPAPDEPALG